MHENLWQWICRMCRVGKRRARRSVQRLVGCGELQLRLDRYEWSDVVDGVAYCPCCHADEATGHSEWCCLYAPNPGGLRTAQPEE